MPSPDLIIEPRNLLYEGEILKLKDKDGNIIIFTIKESNDFGLIVEKDGQTIQFPRAFFYKNEDGSYSPYINIA